MTINPTGDRRLLMRRASDDALGYAFSSGLEAALTRGPHQCRDSSAWRPETFDFRPPMAYTGQMP
jgi:hypothetical protein